MKSERITHADAVETAVRLRNLARYSRALKDEGVKAAMSALEAELTRVDGVIDDELRMGNTSDEMVAKLVADTYRTTPTGHKRNGGVPMLYELPSRNAQAKTESAAKRMLRWPQAQCDRFVWHVATNFEGDKPDRINPHDPMLDFEAFAAFDAEKRADEKEDQIDRKLLLNCARAALSRFKQERIPILIETVDNLVFFAYGGGTTSHYENNYIAQAFRECCKNQLGCFWQHGSNNGVAWGSVLRDGTTAAFARKYKL